MMSVGVKDMINENAPFINYINPVALIMDGLYSLYYYDDYNIYYTSIIFLLIFSFVMMVLSYLFIRRKKYDSI